MKSFFIPNIKVNDLSREVINNIKISDTTILRDINNYNIINSSKTSYLLEHGNPTSYVKKVIN
ncbi:hypothetical protein J6G99_08480 [bacterium]|nr:hypothetical protein [bacterium]